MFYNELIQYEAIESLIQLRDAADTQRAINLVKSFVISEEMAQRITELIFTQLQFDHPADNKGLLVVGNYGTGKSHLLSVISAICGDANLVQYLTDAGVKNKAACIAGKFKVVIRTELGSTSMPLRNILVRELEENLKDYGINYVFPPMEESFSIKKDLQNMMQAFHEVFPENGLILVVDELLDYLRSRTGTDLIVDLNFMREIGESCKDLRFRFIAGIQEAIFDSPRFMFVADSLKRVKDRFEQIRIARNDLKYVVANRLLKKTADQSQKIRTYLEPYTLYYDDLTRRLDEFVALFPIHPDYIDIFERITLIEKREVLKTISLSMKGIIDQEVPGDSPGLLAYDSYWKILSDNPGNRAIPEVKEVIDVNSVLISKLEQAFSKPMYKDIAIRIVNALSIYRLATHDIYNNLGLTSQELKNSLFLYDVNAASLGGDEPDKDLTTLVETVLREITTTVSGQYISSNPENGQCYLDLKKVEDYDAIILKKSDTLGADSLNRYYNEVLRRVMERVDLTPYVTNYNIWQYELTWRDRNAPRSGYLFFGSPNERSTAVPQQDFYLYFVQPYSDRQMKDQKLPDEVFFYLNKRDEEFDKALALYAAADELSLSVSGNAKNVYLQKADHYLMKVASWLRKNIWDAYDMSYQAKRQSLESWRKGNNIREFSGIGQNETANFRDIVNALSSICLAAHFEAQAPEYPRFSVLITGANRKQAVADALRAISSENRTKQALAILEAFQLLDGNRINPSSSPLARLILSKLKAKEKGQVLNRDELLEPINGEEYFEPEFYRLESVWLPVILAAMVYSGDIVLSVVGEKYDATMVQYLSMADIDTLKNFKHIELPKDWNIQSLKALFELVALPVGLAQNVSQGSDEPVKALQESIEKMIQRIIINQRHLGEGLILWGVDIASALKLSAAGQKTSFTKAFLETLLVYNTAAKLKNFNIPVSEIEEHQNSVNLLRLINGARDFINKLNPLVNWLSTAENLLPEDHQWRLEYESAKNTVQSQLISLEGKELRALSEKLYRDLEKIKSSYINHYTLLHSRYRLNKPEDNKKADLAKDLRIHRLLKLGEIDIMPKQQVSEIMDLLTSLRTCFNLTLQNLQAAPLCPHCRYNPALESQGSSAGHLLGILDSRLDATLENWTQILVQNLKDEHTQSSISLLNPQDKAILDAFVHDKELPEKLDEHFIRILKTVLAGLSKVTISLDEIQRVISRAGGSISPADLKRVFERYIDSLTQGKNPDRVRIVLE